MGESKVLVAIASWTLGVLVSSGGSFATVPLLSSFNGPVADGTANVRGVSADGRYIIGSYNEVSGNVGAFRWSMADGIQTYGLPGGLIANALSGDGRFIAGGTTGAGFGTTPVRYDTVTGNTVVLPRFGNGASPGGEGAGLSSDGSVMVGWTTANPSTYRAFRWSASSGMTNLGALSGGSLTPQSYATGVSSDGSVVAGYGNNTNVLQGFQWSSQSGIQPVGGSTYCFGVSGDGNVLVGTAGLSAARWVNNNLQVLGVLPGDSSAQALATSGDGSVVVGYSYNSTTSTSRAFRWTATTGMLDIAGYAASLNLALPGNGLFWTATGVSADGNTIVGQVYEPGGNFSRKGWMLTVPAPGAPLLLGSWAAVLARRRRKNAPM